MSDGRVWGVIPVSEEEKKTFFAEPFEIKDDLTVYEAAMVVAGRHPNLRSVRGPDKGFYLEFLTAGARSKSRQGARTRRSVNVFYALRDAIKRDEIKPTKPVYLPNAISICSSRESKQKTLRGSAQKTAGVRGSCSR